MKQEDPCKHLKYSHLFSPRCSLNILTAKIKPSSDDWALAQLRHLIRAVTQSRPSLDQEEGTNTDI